MSKRNSVIVTISIEKMEIIEARANELQVTTGSVASCLLENGVGVDALDRVDIKTELYLINKE